MEFVVLAIGLLVLASGLIAYKWSGSESSQTIKVRTSGSERAVGSGRQTFTGISQLKLQVNGTVVTKADHGLSSGQVIIMGSKIKANSSGRGRLTVKGDGRGQTIVVEHDPRINVSSATAFGTQYNG